MSLKLQINNSDFIFLEKNYNIVETFIDFVNSFGYGSIEKFHELLLDLKETKNFKEYNNSIHKFSIFYLPLLNLPTNYKDDLDYWIEDTIEETKYLQDYINRLKQALDICFNPTFTKYEDLDINQKFLLCTVSKLIKNNSYEIIEDYEYNNTFNSFTDNIDKNYKIINNMKEPKFTKYIIFKDVSSMCSFCFYKLIEQQPILKHCKNCGRLFIADNKREFCNRILETGLTCYQTYTADTFKQRKQEEPLLREYMNAYRRVQNFCYKNKHLLSDETKTKIYEEIRKIYDVAQNDKTQNIEKYKQKFSWYCYDNLKTKYLN